MNRFSRAILLSGSFLLTAMPVQAAVYITIVEGLGGLPEYGEGFTEQRHQIEETSLAISSESHVSVFFGEEATREALLEHFSSLGQRMTEDDRVAIYLIGHGSFDGYNYKFNIPGPDITDEDLGGVLTDLPGRNHFLVSTSSSSGAMLENLEENEELILISATRNGNERNATSFGTYFSAALSSEEADTNKNSRISIQEAFDFAERGVADYYESDGRLATEHPQLRGEQAASFNIGAVLTALASSEDPEISALLTEQQRIDSQIDDLQLNRDEFSSSDYNSRLRELILQSAEMQEQLDNLESENGSGSN